MQMISLPIIGLCVTCLDHDIEELFDANDFDKANTFLIELRKKYPDCESFMTADIDA